MTTPSDQKNNIEELKQKLAAIEHKRVSELQAQLKESTDE